VDISQVCCWHGGALFYAIRGLALNPNSLSCLNNLGNIYLEQGKSDLAFAQFKKAIELDPNNFSIFSNLLYCSNLLSDLPKEILFDYHCQFGKVLMDFTSSRYPEIPLKNSLEVNRKLKIGFVSADLRDHAVVNFMEPIFANLDQSKFHLIAFSNSGITDSTTDRIKKYFSDWHQVLMMNDYDLAQLIAKLEIDILFDLSGHTAHNRLPVFAMSPAPIQMTWIGYPCTTGLKTMDYVLFEAQTPDGFMDKEYIEKIIYLPMSFPFKPFEPSPSIEPLPALRNGYLTFGVFNSPKKYSSTSINLWIKTLNALPTSKIVFGGVADNGLRKNLLSKFSEKNIGSDRISFLDYMPIDKFLMAHQAIDICLDTYPYSGGTTTNHALWMGVPVLTLRGETNASLQSTGILNSQGLVNWSCANEDEFIEKARYWDKQLEELGQIRFKIRQNFQFGDSETFKNIVHGFEKALSMAWIRYCNKEAPTTFRV
jgi:predicted O-linked N-acetylglucosamine transferase (SPINDLY family)